MKIEENFLKQTFEISVKTSKTILGSDDPNFKRIHHNNHHILLYIKDHIMKNECKSYFEIGTHFGHSLCNVLQSKYKSKYVSCDLFLKGQSIANDCRVKDVELLARTNATQFNKNNYECVILKGNSYSPEMLKSVSRELPDGIDLLFIDGDHRRKAVIADFEMYFPLVNSGGYIVFDDYLPFFWNGKKRECPGAIDHIIEKNKDKLDVVGLIDDVVGCNKLKGLSETRNCDFIVKKK